MREVTLPEIKPVGESSRINMLLHTIPGWGKTTFIGTGGRDFDIIIMRPPLDHVDPIIGSGVREMVVHDWDEVFEGLEQIFHLDKAPDIFAMDSISLLQDVGLDDVYEGVLDQKGPVGSAARKHREAFGPDRGEYRVNMWRLGQWVRRAVSAAEFDLIITAHSFYYEPKGTNEAYIAPWIQGKAMPDKICGMMNIVGYGTFEEVQARGGTKQARVINWNAGEFDGVEAFAKNQFKIGGIDGQSVFPTGKSINPTLPEVWAAIRESRAVTPGRRPTTSRPSNGRPSGRPSARPSARGGRPSRRGSA